MSQMNTVNLGTVADAVLMLRAALEKNDLDSKIEILLPKKTIIALKLARNDGGLITCDIKDGGMVYRMAGTRIRECEL